MTEKVSFPNWQSRLLLGRAARLQPIEEIRLPKLAVRFLQWYERRVLRVDVSGVKIDRPIFLLGLPRSGTTMVMDLLCAHEKVAFLTNSMQICTSCCCAVEDLRRRLRLDFRAERFLADSVEVSAGSPSDAVAMWGQWFGDDPLSIEYHERRLEDFSEEQVEALRRTIRKILWAFGNGDRRFFSKLHFVLPHLRVIRALFPDGKFIHIVRDPRMTANSMIKLRRRVREHQAAHGWVIGGRRGLVPTAYPCFPRLAEYVRTYGAEDIRTTASIWNDAINFVREVSPELNAFHEVRYEDILARPREAVARLIEFCELPPAAPDNRLFWEKVAGIGRIRHQNRYEGFEAVEAICRENMVRYGYPLGAASV